MRTTLLRTQGLSHIHLPVAELDRAERFYRRVFGAERRFSVGADLVFLRTPGNRDLIALHEDPVRRSGGIDHFGFILLPPTDLDEAVRVVKAAGGGVQRRGTHRSPSHKDAAYAVFTDPDGYLIELLARDP